MTRHNIGFMAVDAFAQTHNSNNFKSEHKAQTTKVRLGSNIIMLAKPQTFMNLSGESVQAIMAYYDIPQEKLLVIHDEVDLGYGAIKFQENRGHGGHNGIRNIHQHLGNNKYSRMRLGVDRPDGKMDVANFVLQNFNKKEMVDLPDFLDTSSRAIETYVQDGLAKASTNFNRPAVEL